MKNIIFFFELCIEQPDHLTITKSKSSMEIVAAPTVITKYDVAGARHVDVAQGKYFIK